MKLLVILFLIKLYARKNILNKLISKSQNPRFLNIPRQGNIFTNERGYSSGQLLSRSPKLWR